MTPFGVARDRIELDRRLICDHSGKKYDAQNPFWGIPHVEIEDQRVVLVIEKQESQFRAKQET
jgi:hypothetical protein